MTSNKPATEGKFSDLEFVVVVGALAGLVMPLRVNLMAVDDFWVVES